MTGSQFFKQTLLILLVCLLYGCSGLPVGPGESPTPASTPTLEPTNPATQPPPPATDLPPAPLVVALIPEGSDPSLADAIQAEVSRLAAEKGLRWQVRQSLSPEETAAEVDYMVALPQASNLPELVAGAPGTSFLVVGFNGLEAAPNLIDIGSEAQPADMKAFMGGYIAALMTPEWRVGLITLQDGLEIQRFSAFENGVRYFCGLCRQQYPPYYEYPFRLSLPPAASSLEWQSLADFMRDRLVETVYVSPGAGGQVVYSQLASLGVNIIGGEAPPPDLQDNWVASLRTDPQAAYLEYLPRLLAGERGIRAALPTRLTDVNPNLLPLGRQRLVEEILADVQAGYILTADP